MLIEFCCPVCKAPLAIQKQALGGQVNCPNCQKLILLPPESPLPRTKEDLPPFSPGQQRSVEEIAEAIHISVDPYRRDLENKAELLNDAVEMIKLRNERIKEIETLMLETQRDLWALEVEYDQGKTKHKQTQNMLRETRERLQSLEDNGNETDSQVDTLTARIKELEENEGVLTGKKDRLKHKLTNMIALSERLEKQVKSYREHCGPGSDSAEQLETLRSSLVKQAEAQTAAVEDLEKARDLLSKAAKELDRLHRELQAKDQQRKDLEELVKSSSMDMQNALDDRKQWRKHAQELETKVQELTATLQEGETQISERLAGKEEELETSRTELEEAHRILAEREEDLRLLRAEQKELQETVALWRDRHQETEKAREADKSREADLQKAAEALEAKFTKASARLQKKLETATSDLEDTEAKLAEALETQNKLTTQNLQSEKERKALKKQLADAEERIAELESS
jgi:chromosome segregation protein